MIFIEHIILEQSVYPTSVVAEMQQKKSHLATIRLLFHVRKLFGRGVYWCVVLYKVTLWRNGAACVCTVREKQVISLHVQYLNRCYWLVSRFWTIQNEEFPAVRETHFLIVAERQQ